MAQNFLGIELVIALFSNTAWSIYNFRLSLIKALQKDGHTILVVVPSDKRYVTLLQEIGCHVTSISMDNMGTNPLRDGLLLLRYIKFFHKFKPDLSILFTIKPVIYGVISSWITRTRSISVITGLGTAFIRENLISRIVEILYFVALKLTNKIFFLNQDDMNIFISRGICSNPQNIIKIPGEGIDLNLFKKDSIEVVSPNFNKLEVISGSGINLEFFKSNNEIFRDSFSFILVARLIRDKGIYEFVDAARIVRKRFPGVKFQLLGFIGVQNYGAITQREIDDWVAEDVVEYLGSTFDVRPFLLKANCVVLPSYREGISRTLLEAAALSLPIVTTNVPGCRDVVEDGVNGLLCAPRNVHDLAEKLLLMLDFSDEQLAEMGGRGREKVEREFDDKLVIEKFRESISMILKKSKSV